MYRYKKLMVCLNLDEHDRYLVKYAGFISKMAKSREVRFVYVSDTFDIPDEVKKVYPELTAPMEAAVEEKMAGVVGEHFRGHEDTRVTFKVLEGPLLSMLIACTKDYDMDLLIVGHHHKDETIDRYLSEKLARKAFCSVLIIHGETNVYFDQVLVAVDFSKHALNALDVGSAFAKAGGLDTMHVLNTFKVPQGYYKTGKTYEEFADIMLNNNRSKLNEMLSEADLKSLHIKSHFKNIDNVVAGVQQLSEEIDAGLVVIGARGRSGDISAILLGSITEGLIRGLRRPLLAVKEKGEGLNILEALTSE